MTLNINEKTVMDAILVLRQIRHITIRHLVSELEREAKSAIAAELRDDDIFDTINPMKNDSDSFACLNPDMVA